MALSGCIRTRIVSISETLTRRCCTYGVYATYRSFTFDGRLKLSSNKFNNAQLPSLYICQRRAIETQSDNGLANNSDTREQLLSASLKYVHECGWSEQALIKGAKDCGLSIASHSMFPRGGGDLALYFYKLSNERLKTELQVKLKQPDGEKLNTGEFIQDAIQSRIRMTSVYASSWPSAMAQLSHPNCVCDSVRLLGELVDEIWHLAGDQSADMNWYTKRVLLASLYKASELYMVQDKSEDFADTWTFIDRRFEDTQVLSDMLSTISSFNIDELSKLASSGLTVGANILGVRSFT